MLLYHLGAHHTRQWKSYYSLLRKHSALILKASGAVLYSLPADYMLNNLAGPDVDLDLISFCIFDWQHSLQSAYTHKHRQTLLHTHTHTHIHTHTHKHTHTYIYIYIYIYIHETFTPLANSAFACSQFRNFENGGTTFLQKVSVSPYV